MHTYYEADSSVQPLVPVCLWWCKTRGDCAVVGKLCTNIWCNPNMISIRQTLCQLSPYKDRHSVTSHQTHLVTTFVQPLCLFPYDHEEVRSLFNWVSSQPHDPSWHSATASDGCIPCLHCAAVRGTGRHCRPYVPPVFTFLTHKPRKL